jgi:hypothetical protein
MFPINRECITLANQEQGELSSANPSHVMGLGITLRGYELQ